MHKKVRDVMTRNVASVNGGTPFKDVAEVLIDRGVSAVPVVDGAGHVIGVISEADLLHKEEFREQYYREGYRPPLRVRLRRQIGRRGRSPEQRSQGETAAELMSSPPITVRPYTPVVSAARQMSANGVKRLPVVDDDDRLVGIVSRHDLLTVFVRNDDEIAREIRDDIIEGALWPYVPAVEVSVEGGVVTLTGHMTTRGDARMITRMVARVNGVIDVVDRLAWKRDDTPSGGAG